MDRRGAVALQGSSCLQTTIADFGSTRFSAAKATTARGHVGTITDRRWNATAVTLAGGSVESFGDRETAVSASSGARPTSLSADGSAFDVRSTAASGAGRWDSPAIGRLRRGAGAH